MHLARNFIMEHRPMSKRSEEKQENYHIFVTKDTWGSEVALALFAGVFGAFLLAPFQTFESSATFSAMAMLAKEWVWGIVYFLFGLVSGILPLMEIVNKVYLQYRLYLAFAHVGLWIFVLTMFIRSNVNSTATAIYTVLTVESIAVSVALMYRIGGLKR